LLQAVDKLAVYQQRSKDQKNKDAKKQKKSKSALATRTKQLEVENKALRATTVQQKRLNLRSNA
jgi:hypothetical protein